MTTAISPLSYNTFTFLPAATLRALHACALDMHCPFDSSSLAPWTGDGTESIRLQQFLHVYQQAMKRYDMSTFIPNGKVFVDRDGRALNARLIKAGYPNLVLPNRVFAPYEFGCVAIQDCDLPWLNIGEAKSIRVQDGLSVNGFSLDTGIRVLKIGKALVAEMTTQVSGFLVYITLMPHCRSNMEVWAMAELICSQLNAAEHQTRYNQVHIPNVPRYEQDPATLFLQRLVLPMESFTARINHFGMSTYIGLNRERAFGGGALSLGGLRFGTPGAHPFIVNGPFLYVIGYRHLTGVVEPVVVARVGWNAMRVHSGSKHAFAPPAPVVSVLITPPELPNEQVFLYEPPAPEEGSTVEKDSEPHPQRRIFAAVGINSKAGFDKSRMLKDFLRERGLAYRTADVPNAGGDCIMIELSTIDDPLMIDTDLFCRFMHAIVYQVYAIGTIDVVCAVGYGEVVGSIDISNTLIVEGDVFEQVVRCNEQFPDGSGVVRVTPDVAARMAAYEGYEYRAVPDSDLIQISLKLVPEDRE